MINRLVRFFRILFAPALTYSQRRAIAKRIRKQRQNLIANPDLIVNPELRKTVMSMGKRSGKTHSSVDDIKPKAIHVRMAGGVDWTDDGSGRRFFPVDPKLNWDGPFNITVDSKPHEGLYDDGCEFEHKDVQKWHCPVCGAIRYMRPGEEPDIIHSIPRSSCICTWRLEKVSQ